MSVTRSASPMPEADNFDAWIVTVAADGGLYFGADPKTPHELAEWMKTHPRNREARLYIKADARAPFASVEKVLEIGRAMEFDTPVLLTAQAEHNAPGTMVPPKGMDVSVGSSLPSGSIATVVQLLPWGQEPPLLINNDQTSWPALETTLRRHFQKGDEKLVLLKADIRLPFSEIVRAIDSCRAAGAKVYLAEPGL
jgi:biopolymer transport protein ExbD